MTIHHDKMAYGKLASSSEELSEEKIAQVLANLANEQSEDGGEETAEKDETANKKK